MAWWAKKMMAKTMPGWVKNRWVVGGALGGVFAATIASKMVALWLGVTLVFAAVAAYEWARLCRMTKRDGFIFVGLYCILSGVVYFALLPDSHLLLYLAVLAVIFWVVAVPCWLLRQGRLVRLGLAVIGLLVLLTVWLCAGRLFETNLNLLTLAIVLVIVNDSAAYGVGRYCGRVALSPTISPKKTVEGFLGGVFAVLLVGGVWVGFFAIETPPMMLVLSALFATAILAVLGDLAESLLKRQAGLKDSGYILGGHGGVLDRLDALLPVLPFVFLIDV